jgi:hypothetical protein
MKGSAVPRRPPCQGSSPSSFAVAGADVPGANSPCWIPALCPCGVTPNEGSNPSFSVRGQEPRNEASLRSRGQLNQRVFESFLLRQRQGFQREGKGPGAARPWTPPAAVRPSLPQGTGTPKPLPCRTYLEKGPSPGLFLAGLWLQRFDAMPAPPWPPTAKPAHSDGVNGAERRRASVASKQRRRDPSWVACISVGGRRRRGGRCAGRGPRSSHRRSRR